MREKCLLCFHTIQNMDATGCETNFQKYKCSEEIFQCCNRLFCEEIKGDSFHWPNSADSFVPFCETCFNSTKILWQMEENLKKLNEELEDYLLSLSKEIIILRTSTKSMNNPTESEDNDCEAILGIPFNQPDNLLGDTNIHDSVSVPQAIFPYLVSPKEGENENDIVIVEIFKEEPQDSLDDTFCEDDNMHDFSSPIGSPLPSQDLPDFNTSESHHLEMPENSENRHQIPLVMNLKELRVSLERFEQQNFGRTLPLPVPRNTHRELRIVLERLQFDLEGKVIQPIQPRKRKAAIAAAASLRSRTTRYDYDDDFLVFKTIKKDRKKEDDEVSSFSGQDLLLDDSDMELEDNLKRNKKRRRRNGQKAKAKAPFECVVCGAQFKLAKGLDDHSAETEHINERRFQCKLCPRNYYRISDLQSHNLYHNWTTRDCVTCGEQLLTLGNYKWHNKIHRRGLMSVEKRVVSKNPNPRKRNRRKRGADLVIKHKGLPNFVCAVCSEKFYFGLELDEHSIATGHLNERTFQCSKCPKKYYRVSDLWRHRLCHSFTTKTCEVCGKVSETFDSYKNHSRIHPLKKVVNNGENSSKDPEKEAKKSKRREYRYRNRDQVKFECTVCQAVFKIGRDLDTHSKETGHITPRSFQCNQCPKSFYRQCDLMAHEKMTHNFESKKCDICGHVSTTLKNYRLHARAHKEGKGMDTKFECKLCDRVYTKSSDLEQHMNSHFGLTPYKCDKCEARFGFKCMLTEHQKGHNLNYLQCTLCLELFKNELSLKYHLRGHGKGDQRVKCDLCSDTFFPRKHLLAHQIAEHGAESPFKCRFCELVFNYNKDLAFHLKGKHPLEYEKLKDEIKPFDCEKCGKSYSQISSLRYHTALVHSTIPRDRRVTDKAKKGCYPCEHCGQTFVVQGRLNVHIKVRHLKVLSFICHFCGKELNSSNALTTHLRIHSGNTHDCPICGRGFTERWNLKTHMVRIHEQNKRPRKSFKKTPAAVPKHATNIDFLKSATKKPKNVDNIVSNLLTEIFPGEFV